MTLAIVHPDPSVNVLIHQRAADFIRLAMCKVAEPDPFMARQSFLNRFPTSKAADWIRKAAVGAIDSAEALANERKLGAAFAQVAHTLSALGQMDGLVPAPFNVAFPRQIATSEPSWQGEQHMAKFSRLGFDEASIGFAGMSTTAAITTELARSDDPKVIALVSAELGKAISGFVDQQALDPSKAADDISPASLTYGGPTVAATGTSADALRADAGALVEMMRIDGCTFLRPYWVVSPAMRLRLSLMDGGLLRDGRLGEVPVVTTLAAIADGNSPDDQRMFLVDASEVLLADAGLAISVSREADVQLSDAPDSPATASTVSINLWQRGYIGLKASRFIYWQRRVGCPAGTITGASYS